MTCPFANPPRFCLDHDYDHILEAQEREALAADRPIIVRREVVHNLGGQLTLEASDAGLRGFPFALAIPARDGGLREFHRSSIERDSENDVTHAIYSAGTMTLTVWND